MSVFQKLLDKIVSKNKKEYNNWMSDVSPYLTQIKPFLQEYTDAKYSGTINPSHQQVFEMSQDAITKLIDNFISDTILDPELKHRYLDNLYDRNPNTMNYHQK